MDDILTFEVDNEFDWFTNLKFENIFASVNNLKMNNVPTSWLNEGEKTAKPTQQRKQTESDRPECLENKVLLYRSDPSFTVSQTDRDSGSIYACL